MSSNPMTVFEQMLQSSGGPSQESALDGGQEGFGRKDSAVSSAELAPLLFLIKGSLSS